MTPLYLSTTRDGQSISKRAKPIEAAAGRLVLFADGLRLDVARQLAEKLARTALRYQGRRSGLLIATINEESANTHFLASFLEESGFVPTAAGFQMRRVTPSPYAANMEITLPDDPEEEEEA